MPSVHSRARATSTIPMARSADLIDAKVFEADFFLGHLRNSGTDFFAVRCYFSAFASAARSITFAMQAVLRDTPGFREWYDGEQARLKAHPTARFFHLARNDSQKVGITPVNQGRSEWRSDGPPLVTYHFSGGFQGDPSLVPQTDVASACRELLTLLVEVVYRAYEEFEIVTPRSFFSVANLKRTNLSIEDIEEAVGFPRGWTHAEGLGIEARLKMLERVTPDTAIDGMFLKYLGKARASAT